MNKKNVVILSLSDITEVFSPLLWASAKSYYELKGHHTDKYNWVIPDADYYDSIDEITSWLKLNPPAVLGISLYMWNFHKAMAVAAWVRENYPDCIIISGGPQQYFKHDPNWFTNNPWLDASLPGDEYGERAIADLLDNLTDDNKINWNTVNSVVYPNKTRDLILCSHKKEHKKEFFWEYSSYTMQFDLLKTWIKRRIDYSIANHGVPKYPMLKIETTRGCPYGCSYCDWGGGISSKVISKSLEILEQEIEAISRLEIYFCYICDANSGILGNRDVEVIKLFAKYKKLNGWPWVVHVGGLAKTAKAKDTIKEMLSVLAENNLDKFKQYKIAIQTLDPVIQKNIDRTDVPIEIYAELADYMKSTYGYRPQTEVILGLPGQTTKNFYYELQEIAKYDFTPQFYPWVLLPESPGYDPEYRNKFNIQTVTKSDVTASPYYAKVNQAVQTAKDQNLKYTDLVFVVSTYSYTREEYAEMMIMSGLFTSLYYLGVLKYLVQNSNQLKDVFAALWNNRHTADNKFAEYLKRSSEEFIRWLETPRGNIFYMNALNSEDTHLYSMEEFWTQLVFFEPEDTISYFNQALDSVGSSVKIDPLFDQIITKLNYQTATNKYWKFSNETLVESFLKITDHLKIYFKPDDVFLIDNCQ